MPCRFHVIHKITFLIITDRQYNTYTRLTSVRPIKSDEAIAKFHLLNNWKHNNSWLNFLSLSLYVVSFVIPSFELAHAVLQTMMAILVTISNFIISTMPWAKIIPQNSLFDGWNNNDLNTKQKTKRLNWNETKHTNDDEVWSAVVLDKYDA